MERRSLTLLLLLIALPVFANERIDELVERLMEKRKIPGLALLVSVDGKPVISKGYGYANLEHMAPVKPETIFQSGSVGKQFTATAIMMLVEEGKIRLDDPISKYLPDTPGSWKAITVRHLLTHTSGLGDYPENFNYRADYTEDSIYEIVKKQKLSFSPGEKHQYSNFGYVLLGIIIRKTSGKFYGDFLQERIFQPLGMTATQIINEAKIIPHRAAGYVLEGEKHKNQEWVSPTVNTTADGSLYFNLVDLAKWDEALYTEKLIKKSTLDQMWIPLKLNDGKEEPYGFGWRITSHNRRRLIEHGGSWQGFNTQISRYVEDRLTVVVLANLAGAAPEYIAHAVAGLYNPALALPTHTRIELKEEQLQHFEGEYKFSSDNSVMKVSVARDGLRATYGSQQRELLPESPTDFFIEDSEIVVRFEQDSQGKVTGLIRNSGGGDKESAVKIK